jgi:hypothetical protein
VPVGFHPLRTRSSAETDAGMPPVRSTNLTCAS